MRSIENIEQFNIEAQLSEHLLSWWFINSSDGSQLVVVESGLKFSINGKHNPAGIWRWNNVEM